jgi:hypothetical protein
MALAMEACKAGPISKGENAMLSQIEAPQTTAAIVNTEGATSAISVGITATVSNGAISFSMPTPVTGVSVSGNSVTVNPGSYAITFTLSGDTFTSAGITVSPLPQGAQNVTVTAATPNPATSTTATVNVTNSLTSSNSSVTASSTFNLTKAGPKDPTIVNDPPQG